MTSQTNLCEPLGYNIFPAPDSDWLWRLVAGLEQAIAVMLLLGCAPLLAVTCVFITFLSRRSPLIAHRRVGQSGQDIWIFKLRTMWHAQPRTWKHVGFIEYLREDVVPDRKDRSDPRITSRFAAFCRKYSIDELPQLWLVARGEMSIVGPRPMTRRELAKYYGGDAERIFQAKPGLTGLWQIRGRNTLTHNQRRRLDKLMVEKWSLSLYTSILVASVPKVLSGKDAW